MAYLRWGTSPWYAYPHVGGGFGVETHFDPPCRFTEREVLEEDMPRLLEARFGNTRARLSDEEWDKIFEAIGDYLEGDLEKAHPSTLYQVRQTPWHCQEAVKKRARWVLEDDIRRRKRERGQLGEPSSAFSRAFVAYLRQQRETDSIGRLFFPPQAL